MMLWNFVLCRCCLCVFVVLLVFLDVLIDFILVSEIIFFSEFFKKINSDVKFLIDFNFMVYFIIVGFDLMLDIFYYFGKCFVVKFV